MNEWIAMQWIPAHDDRLVRHIAHFFLLEPRVSRGSVGTRVLSVLPVLKSQVGSASRVYVGRMHFVRPSSKPCNIVRRELMRNWMIWHVKVENDALVIGLSHASNSALTCGSA